MICVSTYKDLLSAKIKNDEKNSTITFEQWFADGLLSMNEHQQDNNGKVLV